MRNDSNGCKTDVMLVQHIIASKLQVVKREIQNIKLLKTTLYGLMSCSHLRFLLALLPHYTCLLAIECNMIFVSSNP
jgi:hypothetical protein